MLLSGVVSKTSHVLGLASCAIAPAMNTGASTQIKPIWRYATSVKLRAPLLARSLKLLVPVALVIKSQRSTRISTPR